MMSRGQSDSKESALSPQSVSLDTFVPAGFVLVTLQLTNSESIDSMIGAYCQVDLYSATPDANFQPSKSALPIATHLRLVRSPNNQSLFGVLVPEDSRAIIQQLTGPVFAVIQGPEAKPRPGPTSQPTVQRKSRSIRYGDLL